MNTIKFVGGPNNGKVETIELPAPFRLPPLESEGVPPNVYVMAPVLRTLECNYALAVLDPETEILTADDFPPDTFTLELPYGVSLAESLKIRQVRLIKESRSSALASLDRKTARYRNGSGGEWIYIPHVF